MTTGFPLHNRGILSEYADFDSRNFSQLVTAVVTYIHPLCEYIKVIFKVTEKQSDVIDSADYGDYYEVPVQIPFVLRGVASKPYHVGQEVLINRLRIPVKADITADTDEGIDADSIQLNYVLIDSEDDKGGGNFELISIDNDSLEMRLDDGVIKIKGLGYAVHTYTYVGNKVDLPAVSSDTTFYVFVEVHSPNILYGFVCSTSLLQDDLSNGIFYVPIYKMKMEEKEVDETTEKKYSIILDMRNGVVL